MWPQTSVNSYDSCRFYRSDNIFNPPSKSRSTILSMSRANRLPACRINRRGNDSCRFDGIGFMNRFPVFRIWIDSSWVYWTTLMYVGLILIHSLSGEGVVYFSCYSDQGCSWIFATSTSGIKFDESLCLMLVLYIFRPSINVYTD